jgi:hypothetical protein
MVAGVAQQPAELPRAVIMVPVQAPRRRRPATDGAAATLKRQQFLILRWRQGWRLMAALRHRQCNWSLSCRANARCVGFPQVSE